MRCDEVQRVLVETEAIGNGLAEAVVSHLAECSACARLRVLLQRVDHTLHDQPFWAPPPGFAQRVVQETAPDLVVERPPNVWSLGNWLTVATTGALVGTGVVLGWELLGSPASLAALLTAPTPTAMWAWVAMSYGLALWTVRRSRVA